MHRSANYAGVREAGPPFTHFPSPNHQPWQGQLPGWIDASRTTGARIRRQTDGGAEEGISRVHSIDSLLRNPLSLLLQALVAPIGVDSASNYRFQRLIGKEEKKSPLIYP